MVRFLHSSDLHIGKRFGAMPEDLRGRLREGRHAAIGRLAAQARDHGAATILLAGDTFDSETPTPAMLRHAFAAMGEHAGLRWVVLPGNHDSLIADELWAAARQVAPANVQLAVEPSPLMLDPNLAILPAPCTTRRPGRDLTEWMDRGETPEGVCRIGLAHGAVTSFSEDGGASDVIAPDRAVRAGLDYLALGDWHGPMRVNDRTWYSGTPEPDRFKHPTPGQALLVTVAGLGATPVVEPVETGSFAWRMIDLDLISGQDAAAALIGRLPAGPARRQILLRVVASGRTALPGRLALRAALDAVTPDFAHAAYDDAALATDCGSGDLDIVDHAGALRAAAEALLAESADEGRTAEDREIAREALVRLFSYCEAIAS